MTTDKRKTKRRKPESTVKRLRKKMGKSDEKMLEAAAIVAAGRRYDYGQLNKERRRLGEIIEHASGDYKKVEERMRNIEEDEHRKLVEEISRPRQSWFW
jgi:hypothetical protein